MTSGLLPSNEEYLRNLHEVWQDIRTLLEVSQETKVPFLVATVILGFLQIFKKSQVLSPVEALNSE